jgi:hypothetical protein
MSTKIVSTASEPLKGEINKKDLQKIHVDFLKHTKLESTDGRKLKKQEGFYIDIGILKAFIQEAEAAGKAYDKLLLQFVITLPKQKTCSPPYRDIANCLSVSFMIADGKGKVKNKVGDGVLTAGFKAATVASQKPGQGMMTKAVLPINCCGNPSGGPGPGGGGN